MAGRFDELDLIKVHQLPTTNLPELCDCLRKLVTRLLLQNCFMCKRYIVLFSVLLGSQHAGCPHIRNQLLKHVKAMVVVLCVLHWSLLPVHGCNAAPDTAVRAQIGGRRQ